MNCVICDSKVKKKENIFQCGNCGHTYINIPIQENIEYQKHYHLSSNCRTLKLTNGKVPQSFHDDRYGICSARVKKIKNMLKRSYFLLDVGGSCGTFALHASPYIDTIEITDLADYQKMESERLGFRFYQGNFNDLEFTNTYDIVTAWHVLEHVNDVHSFIQKCKNLARKYVVIEVPVKRKIQGTIESDGHVHYFTQKSLEILIKKYFKKYRIQEGVQKPSLMMIAEKD